MASQLFNDLGRRSDAQQHVSDSDCLFALEAAGADPNAVLTDAEREHLLTQGYLNLGQLMTPEQCEEAKRRIHAQIEVEEEGVPFSKGSDGENLRLSNLFNLCNDDGMFDVVVTNPRLLAAMRLMLGDSFKLSSLNFRAASPGHGLQGYHTDWGENLASLQDPPEFQVCNSVRDLQHQCTDCTLQQSALCTPPNTSGAIAFIIIIVLGHRSGCLMNLVQTMEPHAYFPARI